MKAMLFAAGLGTRLKPFTDHSPKALATVNNKTLLEHNIRYLQAFGIYEVVINVHHFAAMIEQVIIDNDGFGSEVSFSDERDEVLETGGGLKKAAPFLAGESSFVVMNVDVLTNLDLGKMIATHLENAPIATLAVMKRNSSRNFLFDSSMHLCGWENISTGQRRMAREVHTVFPYAFSGVQVLSGTIFNNIPFEGKFSLVDLYLHLAKTETLLGYDHTGNIFIDVGKPENIAKAEYLFS